jgi:hypothetical protein
VDAPTVSFFGASVTAQKTGYVHHFKRLVGDDFKVNAHGYGSMHIRDAGMCFVDEVLLDNPNYCFIDWFSTGCTPTGPELKLHLDTFRYKFGLKGCRIIFLLLGGSESHMSEKRAEMYKQVMEYSAEHGIACMDVAGHVKQFPAQELYRDTVHTLDFGSKAYGEFIHRSFLKGVSSMNERNHPVAQKTKYSEIKKVMIDADVIRERISIVGDAEIVGLYQNIGPYSGAVGVISDGRRSVQNLWDCWCYYERKVLKIRQKFEKNLIIEVLQDDVERSSARGSADWSVAKVIKPCGFLYFIGDILDVNCK